MLFLHPVIVLFLQVSLQGVLVILLLLKSLRLFVIRELWQREADFYSLISPDVFLESLFLFAFAAKIRKSSSMILDLLVQILCPCCLLLLCLLAILFFPSLKCHLLAESCFLLSASTLEVSKLRIL